jgi:NADPH-dependent 2,4-dienoyl-CoA reductase/sulfur reductase-like enzyme
VADQVLTTVDAELAAPIRATLVRHGVTVHTGVTVAAIQPDGGHLRVFAADGGDHWPADLVVVAGGVRPDTALAATAGATIGEHDAIVVDRRRRTGIDGVYAAGDCVQTWHALLDKPTYLPLGTTAHKQGRVAGANAVGHDAVYAGSLGSQAVKIFDRVIARTGLRPHEAAEHGFNARTVDITVDDHKAYYPGAAGDRRRGRRRPAAPRRPARPRPLDHTQRRRGRTQRRGDQTRQQRGRDLMTRRWTQTTRSPQY